MTDERDGAREWRWGYPDGIPGTPEYEPPARICNRCRTVLSRCKCSALAAIRPTDAGVMRDALQKLRDRVWFIIGVNDPAIVAADAILATPKPPVDEAMREQCAKVADAEALRLDQSASWRVSAKTIAAAIRNLTGDGAGA